VERLPEGGYVVVRDGRGGYVSLPLLACTEIDEALKFVRDKLGGSNGEKAATDQRGEDPALGA